jgi:hypothetical protein
MSDGSNKIMIYTWPSSSGVNIDNLRNLTYEEAFLLMKNSMNEKNLNLFHGIFMWHFMCVLIFSNSTLLRCFCASSIKDISCRTPWETFIKYTITKKYLHTNNVGKKKHFHSATQFIAMKFYFLCVEYIHIGREREG